MKTFLVATMALVAVLPLSGKPQPGPNPPAEEYDETHRFVFFAVLEGCYQDGLTSQDIDLIVPPKDDDRDLSVNFVYSCPLCHPAFEAFRLYGARRPFQGQKVTEYDTFGEGLEAPLKAKLRGEPGDRREAIKTLITRWIERRADLLRLTGEERETLMEDIKAKQEKGEIALEKFISEGKDGHFGKLYADWKECAICSGAAGASMGVENQ